MALKSILASLVLGIIALEYWPTLSNGFVYEDYRWTDACAHSQRWYRFPNTLMRMSWCSQVNWHQSPLVFHLLNLSLHLMVTVLLFLVLEELTHSFGAAFFGAAVFSVHPLAIESVAYASGRPELFVGIGLLSACLSAMHGRAFMTGLCVVFSFFGKETAIVSVALLPLLWFQLERKKPFQDARVILGVVIVSVLSLVGGLLIDTSMPLWAWIPQQLFGLGRLMALALIPLGQTVDYDYGLIPVLTLWIVSVGVFAVARFSWGIRHTMPVIAIGLLWVFAASLPRLFMVTPRSGFNEHQFYVPLMGLSIVIAGLYASPPLRKASA